MDKGGISVNTRAELAIEDPQDRFLPVAAAPNRRPHVHGKFIFIGDEKFYIRGVTYGTFELAGKDEYDPIKADRDFAMMAQNGINSVRVYTVPPRWLLDKAGEHGLRVMVGLPWEQHIAFLDDAKIVRSIETRLREGVRSCASHPAVLCFVIGNEIPASVVRWFGASRIQRFLHRLYKIAKSEDPGALVTYVNFPSTEYLDLSFADFSCFNVYLEDRERYEAYLARLQNLAGDRPLVMAEIGLDSRRNGLGAQAEALAWQVRASFENGCAGAFIFSWTDEWYRGGAEIDDWDFGLTTRAREPKPSLEAVRREFAEVPFRSDAIFPRVSVVVCTFNGSRTLRDCLDGLVGLDYPDYEVIIVNDGSTDDVAEIAAEYPYQLISTPNRGLSSARNTGLEAAGGEIIAYTDDDAHPDPHWLKYLAATFAATSHAGVGGPNIAPRDDGEIAECVANAPGGPIHVLISDTEAEHIPGCNMAFRRESLLAIGGFDPLYRAAGDDVDVCWRIQEKGWTLGFSPAAMVWHHRRDSIRDYWRQQKGYGKAEAMLEQKWAEKYNAVGHLTWAGQLYGKGWTDTIRLRRGRIYEGVWGTAPFQRLYQPVTGILESLPLMPEWYLVIALLGVLVLLGVVWHPLLWLSPVLAVAVAAPLIQAIFAGMKADFITPPEKRYREMRLRAITALLHLVQPLGRLHGRLAHGLSPWRRRGSEFFVVPYPRVIAYWSEKWGDATERLTAIENSLRSDGAVALRNGDFDRGWDLDVRGGLAGGTRLATLIEEHGQGKQIVRFRVYPRSSWLVYTLVAGLAILGLVAALDGVIAISAALGALAAVISLRALLDAGHAGAAVLRAVETVCKGENGVVLPPKRQALRVAESAAPPTSNDAGTRRRVEQNLKTQDL